MHTRKWLPWLLLAAAVAATAAVYWPGVTGGWVFDDYPNIVDNDAIHLAPGHATLAAWVNAALSSPSSFLHRPLASITFALNWLYGGGDPRPFKVTNIVIHLVNGVLLFCMLQALLRLVPARNTSPRHSAPAPFASAGGGGDAHHAATRLALVVSAAWLLLPINLMAVLYVVQRMESLCQLFVVAGLWAYLHGRWMMLTAHDRSRDRRGLALAIAGIVCGTLLGLTSKETAVLLPVFAFLAEAVVLRFARPLQQGVFAASGVLPVAEWPSVHHAGTRSDSGFPPAADAAAPARADRRLWIFFTITLFIPAVLGFAWLLRKALQPGAFGSRDFTLAQRLLTEPRVLVDYLRWTIFPDPAVLSLYHDEIVKSTGLLAPWTTLGSLLLLAVLIVLAVWLRHRRPLVALGIGWFFAAQLLTATIVPLELVYEQRMYFASIGVLLALGALLLGLRRRIPLATPRVLVVAAALLWFGAATHARSVEWSNPLRLAIAEAKRHPTSPRAVYEAGRLLLIASRYQPGPELDASRRYLEQTAAIPGSSALADQALIMLVDHEHHGDDAAYWASMIRKLSGQPTRQEDISALISLTNCYGSGICVFDVARLDGAYRAALSRPHPIARLDGAYAAFQRDVLHDDAAAEPWLVRAVRSAPSESAYRVDLAALYARTGQPDKARQQLAALRRMNLAGRLDRQIARLEQMIAAASGATSGDGSHQ